MSGKGFLKLLTQVFTPRKHMILGSVMVLLYIFFCLGKLKGPIDSYVILSCWIGLLGNCLFASLVSLHLGVLGCKYFALVDRK